MYTRFLTVLTIILAVIATASITMLIAGKGNGATGGGSVSAPEVERIIAQFFVDHPEVITEAFQRARQKQARLETEQAEATITARKDDLEGDDTSPYFGSKDGDVVIVVFSDYNCGFCKRVMPDVIRLLDEDKNIKYVVKDFPILGPQSMVNSQAALAVWNIAPEKYEEFHTTMLKNTPRNDAQIIELANKLGVDGEALKTEMQKQEYKDKIAKNLSLGQSIGVRGTPAFVINGEYIRGAISYDQFKNRVAAARERKDSE